MEAADFVTMRRHYIALAWTHRRTMRSLRRYSPGWTNNLAAMDAYYGVAQEMRRFWPLIIAVDQQHRRVWGAA